MCSSFHDEIDALALDVERAIADAEATLAEYEEEMPLINDAAESAMTEDGDPVDLFS